MIDKSEAERNSTTNREESQPLHTLQSRHSSFDTVTESYSRGLEAFDVNAGHDQKFNDAINAFENELSTPKSFSTESLAHAYFEHAKSFLELIYVRLKAVKKIYGEHSVSQVKNGYNVTDFWLAQTLSGLVFFLSLFFAYGAYVRANRLWENSWGFDALVLIASVPAIFLIALIVGLYVAVWISLPFFKLTKSAKFRNLDPTQFPLPNWIAPIEARLSVLSKQVEIAKSEAIDDVRHAKSLSKKKQELELEEQFHVRSANRSLEERLALISAEIKAAKETAKTLEEQHARTEAIRLQHAKELIDLQRAVKAEANQDLTEKLAMVQALLADTP